MCARNSDPQQLIDRPLVAIANRLPVKKQQGSWKPSTGGLVTALLPIMENQDGAWMGWNGGADDVPRHLDGVDIDLIPISLSHAQLQGYYYGFANRTLWPLFHDLVKQPVFERGLWETYREVNHIFAEASEQVGFDGDREPLLWVHDYHLTLLPRLLRERRPDNPIGFFLHIPFPPPELFARLPWREEILEGLLGADLVAFHTDRFRDNFLGAVDRLLPHKIGVENHEVVLPEGRRVSTGGHPVSIDAAAFASMATNDDAQSELASLREQFAGRTVVLGVDRLDYTKGIHARLKAIELLLERRNDLRGKLAFVQIAVPSRENVQEYRELRADVEQEVGRINGRFTDPGGDIPVYYVHRGVPQQRLVAYYRLANVALVTPLKDGMNLIAKEFVVCQAAGEGFGALVLSEFTGAADDLPEAVACNPFDVEGLSARIEEALELDPDDRRERLERMAARVHDNDVYAWVEGQLRDIRQATSSR
ncbi:MAG: trehalose-6-phosphate synthase [Actinomycetota bacterium]|nr:trehalose-6-phosphate synthase [Actinomycetota bacterium]